MVGVGKQIALDIVEATQAQGCAGTDGCHNFQVPGNTYTPQKKLVGSLHVVTEIKCWNYRVWDLSLLQGKSHLGRAYWIELQNND